MFWVRWSLLSFLVLVPPGASLAHRPAYDRAQYGSWEDQDRNCRDTRQEILIRDSRLPVLWRDEKRCVVAWGHWVDVYSGEVINDPLGVDIDHLVPLQNVHVAGGWRWNSTRRREFSNWEPNLVVTSASENRRKGSKTIDQYEPPNETIRCWYASRYAVTKFVWNLSTSDQERETLRRRVEACAQKIFSGSPDS